MTEFQRREKEFLERRIELLENALCDETTISNISSGSVAETFNREALERELNRTRHRYETLFGGGGQIFGVVLH